MRIISGKYKGKRLQAPKNLPARPTTDMAKESLFNILNNQFYFENITVLDLFAGIGGISFEFASRGSSSIIAVDEHVGCIKFIHQTAKNLDVPVTAIKKDVFKFLQSNTLKVDIVFADPPYEMPIEKLTEIVDTIFSKEMLNEDGICIIEHSKFLDMSQHPYFSQSRKYGLSIFSFFELQ